MKIELFLCDRCDAEIQYPRDSMYVVKYSRYEMEPDELETWQLCCLCYEAVLFKLQAEEIPAGLAGIVKHEEELAKRQIEGTEDGEDEE